jgi:hypothetical protein
MLFDEEPVLLFGWGCWPYGDGHVAHPQLSLYDRQMEVVLAIRILNRRYRFL